MGARVLLLPFHTIAQASATCLTTTDKSGKYVQGNCSTGLPIAAAGTNNLQAVLQIIFAIAGAIAVIMIVVGGLKFISAQGEPSGVAQARKILVFALAGLILALFAETIVSFVLGKF